MRRLLMCLAATLALGLSAEAQCPVSSLTTQDFGTGCSPFIAPAPQLSVGLASAVCALQFKIEAFECCNTFVSSHFIVIGQPNFMPVPLPPPFVPGCTLDVVNSILLGPFPGKTSTVPLPPNPGLVGTKIGMQGVPVYFTTIGMTTQNGLTNGVVVGFE